MGNIELSSEFSPPRLVAFSRNEAQMNIVLNNPSDNVYWVECEVHVKSPLSLAHDSEMNTGRSRVGILKGNSKIKKPIRLYTRPNNYPEEYRVGIVAFIYDHDGAIAERIEKTVGIACAVEEKESPVPHK